MVTYYVFKGTTGSGRAVTDDKVGKKLPKRPFGSWVYEKQINISAGQHLIGASADAVIEGVKKDGYYLWPQTNPDEPKDENVLESKDFLNETINLDAGKSKD